MHLDADVRILSNYITKKIFCTHTKTDKSEGKRVAYCVFQPLQNPDFACQDVKFL